jgi:hypothetical protein
MENKEPEFVFGKKLGIAECLYGDAVAISNMITRLMVCMQETNKIHGVQCEFFRLDFRTPYFDEQMQFPIGALILDIKWGSKKEFEEKNLPMEKEIKSTLKRPCLSCQMYKIDPRTPMHLPCPDCGVSYEK